MANQAPRQYRAETFAQLSEFFKEPGPGFLADVAASRVAVFFRERVRTLGLDPVLCDGLVQEGDVAADLAGDYRRLFSGPLPPYVVPVESIYKKWTSDPECQLPLAGQKGYLMGDPALDMLERYRVAGIALPAEFISMPDHIALQLEYLAHLYREGDDKAAAAFLDRHLDWLGDLVAEIESLGSPGFYHRAALLTRAIVEQARRAG